MFLVDTNVLSEATRASPSKSVIAWLGNQRAITISVLSVFELEYGIDRLTGVKRDRLTQWFEALLSSPGVEVVAVDAPIARAAGRMKQSAERSGRPRPLADLLIAASAQTLGSVVVTRNTVDFEGLGVPLLNPFLGP